MANQSGRQEFPRIGIALLMRDVNEGEFPDSLFGLYDVS